MREKTGEIHKGGRENGLKRNGLRNYNKEE